MKMRSRIGFLLVLLPVIFSPTGALAHTVATGLHGFPAHLLHPLLTSYQVLGVVVASVLAAQHWPASAFRGIYAFILGIVGGWGMQYFFPNALPSYWLVVYFVLLITAGATAAGAGIWAPLSIVVIFLIGATFGLDNYNLDPSLWLRLQPPLGAIISVSVVMFVLGWLLSRSTSAWVMLAARFATGLIGLYALAMLIKELGYSW